MVKSHKEMTHILGLPANPFNSIISNEGMVNTDAFDSVERRYNLLKSAGASDLDFQYLPDQGKKLSLPNAPGKYVGFYTYWEGHAYSFHAINDGTQTHFIYVNRGEPHETMDETKPPNVIVFSLNNGDEANNFANNMRIAANSIFSMRDQMSTFLVNNKSRENAEFTNLLTKKNQKVGNCTIANSNIAWHFQLASDYMQRNPGTDFSTAYEQTKSAYKEMRGKDRIQAFKYLLEDKDNYLYKDAYLYNYFKALIKVERKEGIAAISEIVKNNKLLIKSLIKPLLDIKKIKKFSYIISLEASVSYSSTQLKNQIIHSIRAPLLEEFFKELNLEKQQKYIKKNKELLKYANPTLQKKLIENDISLTKFASTQVQVQLLVAHPNKYRYYASDEALKAKGINPEENNFLFEQANFLNKNEEILQMKKVSSNFLLSKSASHKEAQINNKLRILYSYAERGDEIGAKKSWDELCLVCAERRFCPLGNKYSIDTHSAKWLIKHVEGDEQLQKILGIKSSDLVIEQVQDIIMKKNAELAHKSSDFKKSYQKVNSATAKAESTADEGLVVSNIPNSP
ncbi:Uncharacterised protein [Legionella busanensis]|uniref:Uncharacterized protein n=1 Tax=Legionella busanensis TaxID=190655 RepID=A0A378JJD4_9GAMM|nr:hypothetical protein [Legionella busanensis]STX51274.1 Uncharacterised protein [Legionella busanensis]